jgi:hypothetical protein
MPRLAVGAVLLLAGLSSVEGCSRLLVLPAPGGAVVIDLDAGQDTAAITVTDGGRSSGDRDGGSAPDGSDARACTNARLLAIATPTPTNVMLMVGRNPTMKLPFGAGSQTTRIQAVTQAIRTATATYPDAISFGYLSFPGMDPQGCAEGCCVDSPVAPNPVTNEAIDRALAPCDSGLDTRGCISKMDNRPMVNAFDRLFNVFPNDGQRDIILFADSPPGCGSDSPPQACLDVQAKVETLLQQRRTFIYVIPIVEDVNCPIAVQGGTEPIAPVATMADLSRSVTGILQKVALPYCSFDLTQMPNNKNNVQVEIDGDPVDRNDAGTGDSWSFHRSSSGTIDVHGAPCLRMQKLPIGSVKVKEVFCGR